MGFKPLSRTALTLAESGCRFKPLSPSFLGRRTIIGPMGQFPTSSHSPSPSSPTSSSASSQTSSPPHGAPPHILSDFERPASTPDKVNLVGRIFASRHRNRPSTANVARSQADLERFAYNAAIKKQNTRRWKAGDVYAPHDLSSVEMMKWKRRRMANRDVFEALNLDPRSEYKNYSLIWEYVTQMGRIKHSRDTGLGNVNQRRLAKAVRRSVGMGLMPSVHKHPEMLETEAILQARSMARSSGQ